MNILFICPYTPTSIRTRPHNLIRSLVERGHSLTLATLWESEQERIALEEFGSLGVKVVSAPLGKRQVAVNAARALASDVPLQSLYCWQPELARRIFAHALDSNSRYDVIHVEHLRGARYGTELKRRMVRRQSKPVPIVWDSVDCITSLFEQATQNSQGLFGRWVTRFELGRTRRHESWLVDQFNRTLVTAEQERRAFMQLRGTLSNSLQKTGQIMVLRNGVALSYFQPTSAPREDKTIVFTGKMSYHANRTAAVFLLDQIMPRVWKHVPEARVQIVGYKPARQLLQAQEKLPGRVCITGSVPDIRPYLGRATVAVAPILYGTGIQNKVLEAMAMGTPVVAMPKAVAALSARVEEDFLVASDPEEFACQIVRLLDNPRLAATIGHAGRQYVESNHDWARITEQLESVYHETMVSDGLKRINE